MQNFGWQQHQFQSMKGQKWTGPCFSPYCISGSEIILHPPYQDLIARLPNHFWYTTPFSGVSGAHSIHMELWLNSRGQMKLISSASISCTFANGPLTTNCSLSAFLTIFGVFTIHSIVGCPFCDSHVGHIREIINEVDSGRGKTMARPT